MRATPTRQGKRKACVAGILVLAGVLLFRRTISMNGETSQASSTFSSSSAAAAEACQWSDGMPELYVLKHSRGHPKAGHWFHVAENFTGRRADLKETISGMSGSTVFMQVLDPTWMAGLSPMSRLLIMAGLTNLGTNNVHFVDANRASLSFGGGSSSGGGTKGPTAHIEVDASGAKTPDTEGGGNAEGSDGSPKTQQPYQQQQRQQQGGGSPDALRSPSPGQLGLLEFDPQGRGSEFVVSTAAPLPDRLTVTARGVLAATMVSVSGAEAGGSATSSSSSSGENPEGLSPSGSSSGGGNGEEAGGGEGGPAAPVGVVVRGGAGRGGDSSGDGSYDGSGAAAAAGAPEGREPVCVRYLSTVGASAVQRVDWFPTPEDANSLRRAIDNYCPLPFLGSEGAEEGGEEGVRRLLLYQRDQNRQIRNPAKVIEDLQERLGGGWVVEEMMHDHDRHPCELVETLARVDVLLTAHGFQSMLGLFMRPDSLLFEVFPHKYFKAGYAPMAAGLGVRHAFSMSRSLKPFMGYSHPSTETCMQWYLCRWYARSSDVELDEENLDRLVELSLLTQP